MLFSHVLLLLSNSHFRLVLFQYQKRSLDVLLTLNPNHNINQSAYELLRLNPIHMRENCLCDCLEFLLILLHLMIGIAHYHPVNTRKVEMEISDDLIHHRKRALFRFFCRNKYFDTFLFF